MRGAGAAPPPARAVPSCVEALAPDHGGLAGLGGAMPMAGRVAVGLALWPGLWPSWPLRAGAVG
jgi:hypothetical protein